MSSLSTCPTCSSPLPAGSRFYGSCGQPVSLYSAWPTENLPAGAHPLLFRAGLLAFAAMFSVSSLIEELPLTPDPAAWYLGTTLLSLALVVAPALYGFWVSRAGRPLFRDDALEPAAQR